MRIEVKLKPNAKKDAIELTGSRQYSASVKKPATEGKANEALIGLLSGYFNVPKSCVDIIKGHKSRNKVIEITVD